MTEFAFVLPILLLIMLGAFNIGLAIRAQLQLAQLTQQAAQYLVHHPDYADGGPTYSKLLTYMNSLSSYQLTPLEVNLTVGKSCPAVDACVQQDTISVNYPFGVIFPLIGKLSVGSLGGGALHLGATASTVAATHPVQSLKVKTSGNHVKLTWTPPLEAGSLSLPLSYCIERQWSNGTTLTDDKYYNGSDTAVNSLDCIAGTSSSFTDSTPPTSAQLGSTGYLLYTITAIQANGLQSPAVTGVPS